MTIPSSSSNTSVILVTAATHFPIKLSAANFPVWRKQIQATLIGLDLESFIIGTKKPPAPFLDAECKNPNPEFTAWNRQDQMILSAILGSCSDLIQPVFSSADTARQAWERLTTSYASASRSRVISLKAKLNKNPRGTRSIAEYLLDMKSIADDLALAQSPVDDDDLFVHILSQLGDEFNPIVAALKVRETSLSFEDLYDKLIDFERVLKEATSTPEPILATANYTQRSAPRASQSAPDSTRSSRPSNSQRQARYPATGNNRSTSRNHLFCKFCNFAGHDTKDCRKLARFLTENNIQIPSPNPTSPVVHATSVGPSTPSQPWMVDSGASHHVASDYSQLHSYADYGGPDEIVLGNGSSHGGANNAGATN